MRPNINKNIVAYDKLLKMLLSIGQPGKAIQMAQNVLKDPRAYALGLVSHIYKTAGKRVSPLRSILRQQHKENFHFPQGEFTLVHASVNKYHLQAVLGTTELEDLVLPTGSRWCDADMRLHPYDVLWNVRIQAQAPFTAWIFLSAGTTGSTNPSTQDISIGVTNSLEEMLDTVFTSGEHDYTLFAQRRSTQFMGYDGTNPIYEARYGLSLTDLYHKIISRYFNISQDQVDRSYNVDRHLF